jgi:hypothetical protein
MTKRQLAKLDMLRREFICLSYQTRLARFFKNKEIESEVSLEREITLCMIEEAKRVKS